MKKYAVTVSDEKEVAQPLLFNSVQELRDWISQANFKEVPLFFNIEVLHDKETTLKYIDDVLLKTINP